MRNRNATHEKLLCACFEGKRCKEKPNVGLSVLFEMTVGIQSFLPSGLKAIVVLQLFLLQSSFVMFVAQSLLVLSRKQRSLNCNGARVVVPAIPFME
jgi:hypothetical protein